MASDAGHQIARASEKYTPQPSFAHLYWEIGMLKKNSPFGATNKFRAGAMAMAFLLFGAMITYSASANAHSFTVLIASPNSGPDSSLGLTIYHGFILAAGERDKHPDETADGHLGGLDVNVHRFDSAAEGAAEALPVRLEEGDVDVFVTISAGAIAQDLREVAEAEGVVTFATADLPFEGSPSEAASALKFLEAFEEHFDVAPDRDAAKGYQAARRLEDAIRPFDSAANTPELRQRLEATADGMTW
jgi:hypothetical protein